uniref:(northern house mosquito) hypothetical protein n=1 Tax=Culex pipiens TaxID=7175 RepID=A0A8D8JAS3_CULPI
MGSLRCGTGVALTRTAPNLLGCWWVTTTASRTSTPGTMADTSFQTPKTKASSCGICACFPRPMPKTRSRITSAMATGTTGGTRFQNDSTIRQSLWRATPAL